MESPHPVAAVRKFFCVHQIARFLLFSGLAAVVNIGAGYLLYAVFGFKVGWRYGGSVALAFLAGMGVSFVLNRRFTFGPTDRRIHEELRTFVLVSIGGLVLTIALSNLFRGFLLPWLLGIPLLAERVPADINLEMIGHVAAVGLVAFYSFSAHKLFSFGSGIRWLSR